MNKIKKTIFIVMLLLMLNYLCFKNSVKATEENVVDIYSIGDCGSLLKYKGIVVKTYYAEYKKEGIVYPAYCLDKTKQGVSNEISYSVNIQETIKDVGLWRRVIHGYPYVSYQELGCQNKEEAFTATKQAIYCYIHGNNIGDYEAIGEAGQRTLNALQKIVKEAEESNETMASNMIKITKEYDGQWQIDKINSNYVSKVYSVVSETSMQNYNISIAGNDNIIENILITDVNNNPKNEFKLNEKFKILVPIKEMRQNGEFIINAKAKVNTKPILYGKSNNNNYQDYALTIDTYEEGEGNIKDEYSINETKIEIIKKDEETKKNIEGVEFAILNQNKEIIYKNLKTDKEGKIIVDNLIPGIYYIQEQNTLDGYEKIDDLIEAKVEWMEKYTITVNNRKIQQPQVEIKTKNMQIKRLPKTGM